MISEFGFYSGFPTNNKGLLHSVYAGGKDIVLTCNSKIATATRDLPCHLVYVRCPVDQPVIVISEDLRDAIKDTTNVELSTLAEHQLAFSQNEHMPTRTLGVGGFLWIARGDQEPVQFVIQRNGGNDKGLWSQPSSLASNNPYISMLHALIEKSGIVLVDDVKRKAVVMVPDARLSVGMCAFIQDAAKRVDAVALKKLQENAILSALTEKGLDGYDLSYEAVAMDYNRANIQTRDKIHLSYPHGQFEHSDEFRGYGVKDKHGSFNVHLPFQMKLPEAGRLVTIDCQGRGRDTALYTDSQLQTISSMGGTTKALTDLLRRPREVVGAPAPASGIATRLAPGVALA